MMSSAVWRASYLVLSPRRVRSAIWHHPIGSPHTVSLSREWSIGLTLQHSHLSTHLACHDGAACPHVLVIIMALASCTLEPREHTLETREVSCIGRC
jgi:hypothetical protein